jgi:hypothetical protein
MMPFSLLENAPSLYRKKKKKNYLNLSCVKKLSSQTTGDAKAGLERRSVLQVIINFSGNPHPMVYWFFIQDEL